jgi:hypothetical protein
MKADDMGWPTLDRKFVNCSQFEKEWWAYRRTYHNLVGYDLVAKNLREKCMTDEVGKMTRNKEKLDAFWGMMNTCYQRPKK